MTQYCGTKKVLPKNRRHFGSRYSCFKAGLAVGADEGKKKGKKAGIKQGKQAGLKQGAFSQKMLNEIGNRIYAKDLDRLPARLVKVIASKRGIGGYGNMNKAQVITALRNGNFRYINMSRLKE